MREEGLWEIPYLELLQQGAWLQGGEAISGQYSVASIDEATQCFKFKFSKEVEDPKPT